MAIGSWTGTAASAQLVAANAYRNSLCIQLTNATAAYIGVGEAAESGKGPKLINAGDVVKVSGGIATEAVYVIGNGATGTYWDRDIEYTPGPQVAA
jgi:hypothetical protein